MGIPSVRLEKTWTARDMRSGFGSAVGDTLLAFHWSPAQDLPELQEHQPSSALEFWSGSQRTLWLVGTWLVNDATLPLKGTITRTKWVGNEHLQEIEIELEDNIGFGLMDPLTGGSGDSSNGSRRPSRRRFAPIPSPTAKATTPHWREARPRHRRKRLACRETWRFT